MMWVALCSRAAPAPLLGWARPGCNPDMSGLSPPGWAGFYLGIVRGCQAVQAVQAKFHTLHIHARR